jgi:NitT/TauT family transport system substrate-binding protein
MNHTFGRSAFISGAAAATFMPRILGAQSLTPIRIVSTPQMSVSAALYAQGSSAFQKNGIDATITSMNSGAAIIAGILGGSIEFGNLSMLNLIEAHARSLPLVIESAASVYSSDLRDAIGFVVAKDSPIRSGRDMNGKTLAVPALGDTFTISGSTWIDKTGGDSTTVKFLELPGVAAADAIAGGRVDAAILVQPTLKNAVAAGKCRIIADPFAAIAPRFISTVYACSADYAAKNPAVVARFRKVIVDSGSYVNAHVPEVLPLMAKFTGVDLAVLSNLPFTRMGGTQALKDSHATIQPLIDVAAKYKAIARSYDAKDLIDPAALV